MTSADWRVSRATIISDSASAEDAIGLPEPSFTRAASSAPSRAAVVFHWSCRPSTCMASDGVRPQIWTRPRATNLSSVAFCNVLVKRLSSATGTAPIRSIERRFLRLEAACQMIGKPGSYCQTAIVAADMGGAQLALEHGNDRSLMLDSRKAERQEPARTEIDLGRAAHDH